MAKKPGKKPKGKTRYRGKPTGSMKARGKTRAPKMQALPGMEDMRHAVLGPCCERIADARTQAQEAAQTEDDEKQLALATMRKEKRQSFRAYGIELVRVPGAEKLRVQKSKEKATATSDPMADEDAAHADAFSEAELG